MGAGVAKYWIAFGMTKDQVYRLLYDRQDGVCGICQDDLPKRYLTSRAVNLDHRKSRAHGGLDDLANTDLTHKDCNSRKGEKCSPGVDCVYCYPRLLPSLED